MTIAPTAPQALHSLLNAAHAPAEAVWWVWHHAPDPWPVERAELPVPARRLHQVARWFETVPVPARAWALQEVHPQGPWASPEPWDAREAFVVHLIAHGDAPWVPDEHGRDLWEVAVRHGLTQVVDALWEHPDRPEPAALWARNYPLRLGRGSALHWAVQHGWVGLAQRLVAHGHPTDGLDERRQSVLSGLRAASDLPAWAALGLVPATPEAVRALKLEWAQQKRDRSEEDWDRMEANAALDAAGPAGSQGLEDAWAVVIQTYLKLPFNDSGKTPEEWAQVTAATQRADAYRWVHPKGPWKGEWSVVAALALRDFKSPYTHDSDRVEAWAKELGRYAPEARRALLASDIRPGLPLRGFLRLLCQASIDKVEVPKPHTRHGRDPEPQEAVAEHRAGLYWLTEGRDRAEAEMDLFQAAIQATMALSPNAKSQTSAVNHQLTRGWARLLSQCGAWSTVGGPGSVDLLSPIIEATQSAWFQAVHHPYFEWPEEILTRWVVLQDQRLDKTSPEWAEWVCHGLLALDACEATQYWDVQDEPLAVGAQGRFLRRVASYHQYLTWAEQHLDAPRVAMRWFSEEEVHEYQLKLQHRQKGDAWKPAPTAKVVCGNAWFPVPEGEDDTYWFQEARRQQARFEALPLHQAMQGNGSGVAPKKTRL